MFVALFWEKRCGRERNFRPEKKPEDWKRCCRKKYTIVIDDETNRVDVHDLDGVRIGARFDFDYRVEDAQGKVPEDGLIMYSMNDMDNASMATQLQTDADWGTNALGNDFRWAEGFGIKSGAASFAVLPYYNHEIYVDFIRRGLFGMFRIIGTRSLITIFLIAGFALLVMICTIAWMLHGRKKSKMPDF